MKTKIIVTSKGTVLKQHTVGRFQYFTCPNQTATKGKRLAENPIVKH